MFLKKKHKYNAQKVEIDGIKFDSILESRVYQTLISRGVNPDLQHTFVLQEGFTYHDEKIRPITYKADFVFERNGDTFVLDAKGMILPEAKIKAKMMLHMGLCVIYLKSIKQTSVFCDLLDNGLRPNEIRKILTKKK